MLTYPEIVGRRRAFTIPGYKTVADVDFDGPWVTPYQESSCSPDGPVLVAWHWSDDATAISRRADILKAGGFLPGIPFNMVLDRALELAGMQRRDIYMTQAFHLLPAKRSAGVPWRHVKLSFEQITLHELTGRKVLALGGRAAAACAEYKVRHVAVCHPSRRGWSFGKRAEDIARGLARLGFGQDPFRAAAACTTSGTGECGAC